MIVPSLCVVVKVFQVWGWLGLACVCSLTSTVINSQLSWLPPSGCLLLLHSVGVRAFGLPGAGDREEGRGLTCSSTEQGTQMKQGGTRGFYPDPSVLWGKTMYGVFY